MFLDTTFFLHWLDGLYYFTLFKLLIDIFQLYLLLLNSYFEFKNRFENQQPKQQHIKIQFSLTTPTPRKTFLNRLKSQVWTHLPLKKLQFWSSIFPPPPLAVKSSLNSLQHHRLIHYSTFGNPLFRLVSQFHRPGVFEPVSCSTAQPSFPCQNQHLPTILHHALDRVVLPHHKSQLYPHHRWVKSRPVHSAAAVGL